MENLFVKIMILSAVVMYGCGGQEEKGPEQVSSVPENMEPLLQVMK